MRVLALDPGGATGFATWDDGAFNAWHVDGQFEALDVVNRELPRTDHVVMESFTITSNTAKKTRGGSNTAIEIIGAVKWMLHERGMSLLLKMQSPVDARTFSTNEKLQVAGFITPANPDHARSAARHLLLYLVLSQTLDPRMFIL